MINKFRRRFILIATGAMTILMGLVVAIINIVNYSSIVNETDTILRVISNQDDINPGEEGFPGGLPEDFIGIGMSPEISFESRFFIVYLNDNNDIIGADTSRTFMMDLRDVKEYAEEVLSNNNSKGFVDDYRYLVDNSDTYNRIFFLDCGRRIEAHNRFLLISCIGATGACLIAFFAFFLSSKIVLKPAIESYEKQKRFISDASHEIKTPLTIINANIDLLEEEKNSEEIIEIKKQTGRLVEMTNDLVLLSKMEEKKTINNLIELPFSDMVNDDVNSFKKLAITNEVNIISNIENNISIIGDSDALHQLIRILLENAIKYSPKSNDVNVDLIKKNKNIILTVSNNTNFELNENNLKNVFERFYRLDSSRNSSTGGHGIGLSIAQNIVESHKGKISASTTNGHDFIITVIF